MYIAKKKFFDSRLAWVQAGDEMPSNPHTDRLYDQGRLVKKSGRKAAAPKQNKMEPEPQNKAVGELGNDELGSV